MTGRCVRPILAALCLIGGAALTTTAQAGPPDRRVPARFLVGADVESLAPNVPVYAGGFGPSPAITAQTGRLQVRSLYVSNGRSAVAFSVVDAQGYFAGYQEGPGFGITSIRTQAAAALNRSGAAIGPDDIIVQATHSHSAPTLEGIWGPTPTAYLAAVHDATVRSLQRAASHVVAARLQYASVNAPSLDNVALAQYDSFPGWSGDGQLTVLRAVTPGGRTVASYVTVPAHPDIVCGACLKTLTPDYFGVVREALDAELGGVTLVGPATLGREETPVQATGLDEAAWFARVVTSLVTEGLRTPHWVRDPAVAGVGRPVTVAGTNAALLALVAANSAPQAVKSAVFARTGQYPIDRADTPPYQAGLAITTPLTALRIGPLIYTSMPGEPFPEIRENLAAAVGGAAQVVALSKGQDDLGYFYPSWVYPFAAGLYPTDQGTFSVSPVAGDEILQGQLANIARLGFPTRPVAVPAPLPTDFRQALHPALQALAAPTFSTAEPGPDGPASVVVLQAFYSPADQDGAPLAGPVHWDFGDATSTDSPALSFGGPCRFPNVAGNGLASCPRTGPAFVTHAFAPGSYTVKVTGHDAHGEAVAWSLPVVVHPVGTPMP